MATQINDQEKDEIDLAQHAITDVEAFAELYRRHLTRVYRYHVAHAGNARDAEDLTSQTFMAALEGIGSFRGAGSFAAWILGIASRKRLMFFRSNGGRMEVPLDAALQYPSPGMPTDQPYIQPVWRFHGRYDDGNEFDVLIQALKQEFLLPELVPGLSPG